MQSVSNSLTPEGPISSRPLFHWYLQGVSCCRGPFFPSPSTSIYIMRSLNETNTRPAAQDTRNGSSSRSKLRSQINSPWTATISPSNGFFGRAGHNESFLLPTAPSNVFFLLRTAMSQANHNQIKPTSKRKKTSPVQQMEGHIGRFLGIIPLPSFASQASCQHTERQRLHSTRNQAAGRFYLVASQRNETRQRDQKMNCCFGKVYQSKKFTWDGS